MRLKPKKTKWGYLQGACDRCGEDDLHLIRLGNETVCDTCADLIQQTERAKIKIKQCDEDTNFIQRALMRSRE